MKSAVSATNLIRVLEISQSSAAGYAGALLAEIGHADGGNDVAGLNKDVAGLNIDVARLNLAETGEFSPGGEVFLHHQKNTLEKSSPDHATAGETNLLAYDVVIEDIGSAGLSALGWSYRSLRKANPALVIVSLSPFGLKGAYKDWQGNDFLAQAVGGVMHTCGYEGEAPLALPGDAAFMIAGLHAATAALTALCSEQQEDARVHIEISAQDTFMQHWTRHVAEYAYSGVTARRAPRQPEGLHYRHTAKAADGWLYLLALREPWQDLAAFLGLGEYITGDALLEGAQQPAWGDIEESFSNAIAAKSKYQWFADAAELGWTFAPVEDPFEIAASPQVAARGGMACSAESGDGSLQMPPLPWLSDD